MNKKIFFWIVVGIVVVPLYGLLDPLTTPFPPCPFRTLTGYLCPGCGSQRAMHQLLHGHPIEAFKLNALFIPSIVYALFAGAVLLFIPDQWQIIRKRYFGLHAAYISLAIVVAFSIGRNIF